MTTSISEFIISLLPVPVALFATAVFAVALIQFVGISVYRLYFHPLANVPGPFFAKVTYLYSFYYNFLCSGRFYMKIEELHKKHGEIYSSVAFYFILSLVLETVNSLSHGIHLFCRTCCPYYTR